MPDLSAPHYALARFAIERGVAAIYVLAFVAAARQFPALCGERGLQPAPLWIEQVPFRRAPSLFYLGYRDRALRLIAWAGATLAGALVLGLPQRAPLPVTMACWLALWLLYLSIVNVGGIFYSFGWESMLLEAGFFAIFLGNAEVAPQWPVLLAFRWLAFRIELGAGLIKLRGDRCWHDLTAMNYHHETQPMPNPLSAWFHRLPRPLHRAEVLGNFGAQLIAPFGLLLPQPIAAVCAAWMIAAQLYLIVSGNYAWLNWLTLLVLLAAIPDPFSVPVAAGPAPAWFTVAVLAVALLTVVLSGWPVKNFFSRHQAMNASFNPFHLVNAYGAFGSISRERFEVIVEGTSAKRPDAGSVWREYVFRGKPGPLQRTPPQVAPYHLRLDWLMWFLPLSSRFTEDWFVIFLLRLLQADAPTLALLRTDPFGGVRPKWVRARLFRYRFSKRHGAVWDRAFFADYVRPVSLATFEEPLTPSQPEYRH